MPIASNISQYLFIDLSKITLILKKHQMICNKQCPFFEQCPFLRSVNLIQEELNDVVSHSVGPLILVFDFTLKIVS